MPSKKGSLQQRHKELAVKGKLRKSMQNWLSPSRPTGETQPQGSRAENEGEHAEHQATPQTGDAQPQGSRARSDGVHAGHQKTPQTGRTAFANVTNHQQAIPPKMDTKKMKSEPKDQDEEAHTHSFSFSIGNGNGKRRKITCDRAQTITDSLMINPIFAKNAQKNEGKELVILRDMPAKAISTHFPCCLIKPNEHLTIRYRKAEGIPEHPKSESGFPQHKPVVFHVKTKGDDNITNKVLNSMELKRLAEEVSVYAYKGEKVEDALKRDGRFKSDIFSPGYALKGIIDEIITDMTSLVDDLDGITFKITLDEKNAPLEGQSDGIPNESPSDKNTPQQSAANVSVNTDLPEHTALAYYTPTLAKPLPIPDSEEIIGLLRAQFKELVKQMKGREGKNTKQLKLFRVGFGKSVQTCKEVKMMKQLMVSANSVCQVRVNGRGVGSGFLLFDKFILTNAHVFSPQLQMYHDGREPVMQDVTVSFSFEDIVTRDQLDSVPVKREVVVFEKLKDDSGCYHDLALLELDPLSTQNLPPGLLRNFATPPLRGGICIVGHPDGGVKKLDPCFIIPVDDREKVLNDRWQEIQFQLITAQHFDFTQLVNPSPQLAYQTCFFYGSSGSPVFDEHCNVVAMHTGGYVYETQNQRGQGQRGQPQSFIEYAQPLSRILQIIILKIVERKRFDVLEAYLIHKNDKCVQVEENVKITVKRENRMAFQNILETYDGDSEKIREFIQFFCPQEESEPMETE